MNGKQAKFLRKLVKNQIENGFPENQVRMKALKRQFKKLTHIQRGQMRADFS